MLRLWMVWVVVGGGSVGETAAASVDIARPRRALPPATQLLPALPLLESQPDRYASRRRFRGGKEVEEPSSGLGLIIPGAIMLGVGALNAASMGICFTDFYVQLEGTTGRDLCAVTVGMVAVGLMGAGLPMLLVGVSRRSAYRAWQEENGALTIAPTSQGIAFAWTRAF